MSCVLELATLVPSRAVVDHWMYTWRREEYGGDPLYSPSYISRQLRSAHHFLNSEGAQGTPQGMCRRRFLRRIRD